MIDYRAMEEALDLLDNTADEFAIAKADLGAAEILVERVKAREFLVAEGSVDVRKAKAKTSADVMSAEDAYVDRLLAFERIKAKRQRAEIFLEVWRSVEASRRKV